MNKYGIYLITDNSTSEKDFFFTKIHYAKAIYNMKKYKTNTQLKTIVNNNNYTLKLLKTYETLTRPELKTELEYWREYYERICADTYANKIKGHNITGFLLHNITKNTSLTYGLTRQACIYKIMCDQFNDVIHEASYKYSLYDFYGQTHLYEVKSLNYSSKKYNTAVMNTNKLVHNNMIFVFEYTESNGVKDLFFHKYDKSRKYITDFITPCGRLNVCEIIRIPIAELIKIEPNKKYDVICDESIEERNLFKKILWLDNALASKHII